LFILFLTRSNQIFISLMCLLLWKTGGILILMIPVVFIYLYETEQKIQILRFSIDLDKIYLALQSIPQWSDPIAHRLYYVSRQLNRLDVNLGNSFLADSENVSGLGLINLYNLQSISVLATLDFMSSL